MQLPIRRINTALPLPAAEHRAAGYDLPCRVDMTIQPHAIGLMPVNIAVDLPEGYFIMLALRSSTPMQKGLMLANGVGIVDPFHRTDKDEMMVELYNYTDKPVEVKRGELLAQAIIIKYSDVSWIEVKSFDSPGSDTSPVGADVSQTIL